MYAPVGGSLGASVVVAALPLLVVALLLGVWRAPAWRAASFSLAAALGAALLVYGMPGGVRSGGDLLRRGLRPVPDRMAGVFGQVDPAHDWTAAPHHLSHPACGWGSALGEPQDSPGVEAVGAAALSRQRLRSA